MKKNRIEDESISERQAKENLREAASAFFVESSRTEHQKAITKLLTDEKAGLTAIESKLVKYKDRQLELISELQEIVTSNRIEEFKQTQIQSRTEQVLDLQEAIVELNTTHENDLRVLQKTRKKRENKLKSNIARNCHHYDSIEAISAFTEMQGDYKDYFTSADITAFTREIFSYYTEAHDLSICVSDRIFSIRRFNASLNPLAFLDPRGAYLASTAEEQECYIKEIDMNGNEIDFQTQKKSQHKVVADVFVDALTRLDDEIKKKKLKEVNNDK